MWGIANYQNKLDVPCPESKPPCVKIIDKTGRMVEYIGLCPLMKTCCANLGTSVAIQIK